jgi:hypothetical protein
MKSLGWMSVELDALDIPIKDKGTATKRMLSHDPSSRCREDWRGENLEDLVRLDWPVGGSRVDVSVGGMLR